MELNFTDLIVISLDKKSFVIYKKIYKKILTPLASRNRIAERSGSTLTSEPRCGVDREAALLRISGSATSFLLATGKEKAIRQYCGCKQFFL